MQLEQNINLIFSSPPGCLETDSGATERENSCAVYFLADLILIIIDVETWNGLLALYPPFNNSHSSVGTDCARFMKSPWESNYWGVCRLH